MFRQLTLPRFGIRALLVFVAVIALSITVFQMLHSKGAAKMAASAELQEYRIFTLEESQIGESHYVNYTPYDSQIKREAEVPVFNRIKPSFFRNLLGDELFVDYETVVVDLYVPIEDLELKIAELGEISKIYFTINSGLDETHVDRIRRRFPKTEIVKLELLPDLRALETPRSAE